MRALVTGLTGFAGQHLKRELELNGYEVYNLCEQIDSGIQLIDIRDYQKVLAVVKSIDPDAVFHLAAQSLASRSWTAPQETLDVNIIGTVNLLEALRTAAPASRVLLIGSSDQYGLSDIHYVSVTEDFPQLPKTPYAVSKCAQELLGKIYADTYGMHICMTRTFMCAGPGQESGLVLSDFSAGVAAVEQGLAEVLQVGNLDSERDFIHIKDAVRAYRLISEQGIAGEVYNVGSGEVHSIREVLQELLSLAICEIPVLQTSTKIRPKDVRGAPCNHDKLTELTNWKPQISFKEIIRDELDYWRERTRNVQ